MHGFYTKPLCQQLTPWITADHAEELHRAAQAKVGRYPFELAVQLACERYGTMGACARTADQPDICQPCMPEIYLRNLGFRIFCTGDSQSCTCRCNCRAVLLFQELLGALAYILRTAPIKPIQVPRAFVRGLYRSHARLIFTYNLNARIRDYIRTRP